MSDDAVDLRRLRLGKETDVPQVDAQQRNLAGHHPFRPAQDRAVAAQDDHQLDPVLELDWLGERHHCVREPIIEFGQITGRQRGDNAGRAQSLDQSIRCGDCGWSAHVSEHGDAAYRICTCTAVLAIPLGCSLGHLPQHIELARQLARF